MPKRPNILYAFTDQQYAGAMSCAGNQDLHTPAMDSLADSGVRFDRAYCTVPLCSPSRSSMLTGLMPHQTGVPRNGMGIDDDLREREMGTVFARAGYECAYAGKWHLPRRSITSDHGFETIAPFGDNGLGDACEGYFARKHKSPFLLVVSILNPHDICQFARNMPLPQGPIPQMNRIEDCPDLPANFAISPLEPEIIRVEQHLQFRRYPVINYSENDWRAYRWGYYRLTEKADAVLAQILDALRAHRLDEDTLVIFSSDHGDGNGAHQWNQKSVLYEETVRIPLIVRPPGGLSAGRVDRNLVSNGLDLLPTLCDYAEIEPPKDLPGLSLRPLLEDGEDVQWRKDIVAQTTFDGDRGYETRGRMLRTDRYKYIVYHCGKNREQLFDMETDEGEMVDLALEERFSDVLDEHRDRLGRWCRENDDNFIVPGFGPSAGQMHRSS